jgi:Homeodomain-like domain
MLGILAGNGVKMRGQGIPEDRLNDAIQRYRSGWPLKRVAAHFGCSAETVRQTRLRRECHCEGSGTRPTVSHVTLRPQATVAQRTRAGRSVPAGPFIVEK